MMDCWVGDVIMAVALQIHDPKGPIARNTASSFYVVR